MIFDKFFKANWQHKNANVRVQAIENELSVDNETQFTTLTTLIASDPNELVRRAALIKVDDFNVYLTAAFENDMPQIRKFSHKQVEQRLTQPTLTCLSQQVKRALVDDYRLSKSLLENWLKAETEPDIITALFTRIDKPQLLVSTFKHHQQHEVQQVLLTNNLTTEQLEKLLKHACNENIAAQINNQISQLQVQQARPGKIEKSCQLLLSKYLALKEEKDYQQLLNKQQQYDEQWHDLATQFNYLSESQQATLTDKYQEITRQVKHAQHSNAEAFEQQKIVKQQEKQRIEVQKALSQSVKALKNKLHDVILNESTEQVEAITQQTISLAKQIDTADLSVSSKEKLQNDLQLITDRLTHINDIIDANARATQLIAAFSQKAVPESILQYDALVPQYYDWLANWKNCYKQASDYLPEYITEAYQEINTKWQQAIAPFKKQRESDFRFTQRKLNDTKHLINIGKYNAAFGVFKGAKNAFDQLQEKQQDKLTKLYQSLEAQLAELNDWDHYVSTPKKQALLTEVEQLANIPLDNPKAQAEKVKAFRQQWNSLGHADDALEQELNTKFNEACERAFSPCRVYFAEQEATRERNYTARLALIEQAEQLVASTDLTAEIDKQSAAASRSLTQKWRQAGEIERKKYQQLNAKFKKIIAPFTEVLNAQHLNNSDAKQALIKKAEVLRQSTDVHAAVKEAKALQTAWKSIGFCGSDVEHKLWQQFRQINDDIFARKTSYMAEVEQQTKQAIAQVNQEVERILQHNNNQDSSSITASIDKLNALLVGADKSDQAAKSVNNIINKAVNRLHKQLDKEKGLQQQQQWLDLFALLEDIAKGNEITEERLSSLSKSWQKRITACLSINSRDAEQRQIKTLSIEVLADLDSPECESQQRLQTQVALMQEKMTPKNEADIEHLFIQWLSYGQLTEDDLPMLARIKPAFI